jgi:phosphatidylinositol alpha 1,6-mannosyltransferase
MRENPDAPLKVAFFAGSMKPGQDGVTRVLYRTIEALTSRGIESLFISPILPEVGSLPVRMMKGPSVAFPFYRDYRLALPGTSQFERELLAFHPDLLHLHTPCLLGQAALRYGRTHQVPVIATYHTHFSSYAKYYNVRAFEEIGWEYLRRLYNRCARVYVPSERILSDLRSRGIHHLEFLPHGVDCRLFDPSFRSEEWRRSVSSEGKPILLFAGRLVWEKDLRTLVEASETLLGRRQDWVLALAGDGPVRRELEGAMPHARFLGRLGEAALSTAYASSDIFVFPSTTETFGNVTIEAMASGLPPICAREGGASGSIEHGVTGFVTRGRDARDLVLHIERLLDHPELRAAMGGRALEYARTQTWESVFKRLFEGYEEVVRGFPYLQEGSSFSGICPLASIAASMRAR